MAAPVFSKFGRTFRCMSIAKNNPKIFEYFEYTTSFCKLLIQQKNSGVAGGLKIMYLSPFSKEPRGILRTMSSI